MNFFILFAFLVFDLSILAKLLRILKKLVGKLGMEDGEFWSPELVRE